MLLDTLATQPTPELAVVMLQLVQSRQLSALRASLMINAMSLVVKPTPAVILTALVRHYLLTNWQTFFLTYLLTYLLTSLLTHSLTYLNSHVLLFFLDLSNYVSSWSLLCTLNLGCLPTNNLPQIDCTRGRAICLLKSRWIAVSDWLFVESLQGAG